MSTTKNETNGVAANEKAGGLLLVDLNGGNLPNLADAQAFPFDLMADYWTPEQLGESKRLFFDKIATRVVLDQQTGDSLDLECVFFIEVVNNEAKTISNGSKRLVGAIESNNIQRGTPLLVTYMGKKRNRTNQFQSDNWSIKLLQISI